MRYTEFSRDLYDFASRLEAFMQEFNIPQSWLDFLDHAAIKTENSRDFDRTLNDIKTHSELVILSEVDDRYIAAAKIAGGLTINEFARRPRVINWMEIMEPRPEKIGNDFVGLEHVEFYYPNIDIAIEALEERMIDFELESNDSHEWITIPLSREGEELKLSDTRLRDILRDEIESGRAHTF